MARESLGRAAPSKLSVWRESRPVELLKELPLHLAASDSRIRQTIKAWAELLESYCMENHWASSKKLQLVYILSCIS
jgi:hypothetical protein